MKDSLMNTIHFKKKQNKKIKVVFINPPHADWCMPQIVTYLSMRSHYDEFGRYPESIEWVEPPHKWNKYVDVASVFQEIGHVDILLFSSYIWNYVIVDEMAKYAKLNNPDCICVLGGPHIGTKDKEFLSSRWMYDYIASPTTPGESFILDLFNNLLENNKDPRDISFELRSEKKTGWNFSNISIYRQHLDYLKKISRYAEDNDLEKFMVLETTRGCPFSCTYCEWGGGTGTKIIKKSMDVVKQDIEAIRDAGFIDVYSTDANFGVFFDRDAEILLHAYNNGIRLTDVTVVKTKNLEKRKQLIDLFHKVNVAKNLRISIQSISDEALKVAKRVDLSLPDKIELGRYIVELSSKSESVKPGVELILAMPGSTLEDFYKEYILLQEFDSLRDYRYDYMVLPDSEAADPEYCSQHGIELVDVYSDSMDGDNDGESTDGVGLYRNRKLKFKTIASCYSYTRSDMCEMYFMNYASPDLIDNFYCENKNISIDMFLKTCYRVICEMSSFSQILFEVQDLLDPQTPAKNCNSLLNLPRLEAIQDIIRKNKRQLSDKLNEAFT